MHKPMGKKKSNSTMKPNKSSTQPYSLHCPKNTHSIQEMSIILTI